MRNEGEALKEVVDGIQYLWRHRKGQIIPASIHDVIISCWQKEDFMPLIVKKKKYQKKWTFIIHLPAGIGYAEFKSKEMLFADATGGAVVIEKNGKGAIIQVLTEQLKECYDYAWDWSEHKAMHLPIPFGYSAMGLIVRDLSEAPNLIVAGHPGAGKSNFLHVVAVSLLLARKIHLCIIDLKRLEFSYLKEKALLVTELDKASKLLQAINKQIDTRLGLLDSVGVVKVQDYEGDMPFIVLMVDELAEMQDEKCQTLLNRILRLGRAVGVCVVCATQRPSSSMFQKFGDSKAMFSASMCFHVRDEVNSRMVLDNSRASLIPNIKGRAIYQWEIELEIQSMFLPVKQAKELIADIKQEVLTCEQSYKRLLPR